MKKKVFLTVAALLLVAMLACSLFGCMKIGMKKNTVVERLTDAGYTIVNAKPKLDLDQNIMQTVDLKDYFYAGKIDGEGESASVYVIYAYYCASTASANTLEDLLNDSGTLDKVKTETGGKNCMIYRYEDIIFIGDFDSVTTARNY